MRANEHQGLFGESFVNVLASAAGLTAWRADRDQTGEDFILSYPGRMGNMHNPRIGVQVKSWSRKRANWSSGAWKYRMRSRHFNDLAAPDGSFPRYLFLVIVPSESSEYAKIEQGQLVLQHAAYWVAFQDKDPVDPTESSSVGVDVPEKNLLTVPSLLALFERNTADRVVSV